MNSVSYKLFFELQQIDKIHIKAPHIFIKLHTQTDANYCRIRFKRCMFFCFSFWQEYTHMKQHAP